MKISIHNQIAWKNIQNRKLSIFPHFFFYRTKGKKKERKICLMRFLSFYFIIDPSIFIFSHSLKTFFFICFSICILFFFYSDCFTLLFVLLCDEISFFFLTFSIVSNFFLFETIKFLCILCNFYRYHNEKQRKTHENGNFFFIPFFMKWVHKY